MPKTQLNSRGQPITAPKPPSWTRHRSSQPQPNAYITRTVLSNGYVAYRPELTTRFPDYKFIYCAPWTRPLALNRETTCHWDHDGPYRYCDETAEGKCLSRVKWNASPDFLPHKLLTIFEDFPFNSSICWSRNCAAKKGHLRDVRIRKPTSPPIQIEQQEENKAVQGTIWWLKFNCRGVPEEMRAVIQQEDEERVKQEQREKDRLKESRFRGSGRVVVSDDPVRDGQEIAFSEEVLPSDLWRVNRRWTTRADEEEGEDNISMEDIVRDEPAYTVRTVAQRAQRKTTKRVVKKRVSFKTPLVEEIPYLQPPELLHPGSAGDCGLSVGSDSGCEYDARLDFSEDEAQGWVPVMVQEDHDEEEEGWVLLTGSWMMLGGAQERNMVKMLNA